MDDRIVNKVRIGESSPYNLEDTKAQALIKNLANVAKTGNYNDLENLPELKQGTIEGVSINGTSIATGGIANITSIPAGIIDGQLPASITSSTQSQGDNSNKIATTEYVDTAINNLPNGITFKGSLGAGGTITQLPSASPANNGDTYIVIEAGTYAGQSAIVGDSFRSNGNTWILIPKETTYNGTVTSIGIEGDGTVTVDDETPITSSGVRTISHANSGVTQGVYGANTSGNLSFGDSFTIPYLEVNKTGHATSASNNLLTLPRLGTSSETAFRGDQGQIAYEHASDSGKIDRAINTGLYKIAATSQGHISALSPVQKSDITDLGIPGANTVPQEMTYSELIAGAASTSKTVSAQILNQGIQAMGCSIAECNTAAYTADKIVTVNNTWTLHQGALIAIRFINTNTASNPTLNVNSSGAKSIIYNGSTVTSENLDKAGTANLYSFYIYNGQNWIWLGQNVITEGGGGGGDSSYRIQSIYIPDDYPDYVDWEHEFNITYSSWDGVSIDIDGSTVDTFGFSDQYLFEIIDVNADWYRPCCTFEFNPNDKLDDEINSVSRVMYYKTPIGTFAKYVYIIAEGGGGYGPQYRVNIYQLDEERGWILVYNENSLSLSFDSDDKLNGVFSNVDFKPIYGLNAFPTTLSIDLLTYGSGGIDYYAWDYQDANDITTGVYEIAYNSGIAHLPNVSEGLLIATTATNDDYSEYDPSGIQLFIPKASNKTNIYCRAKTDNGFTSWERILLEGEEEKSYNGITHLCSVNKSMTNSDIYRLSIPLTNVTTDSNGWYTVSNLDTYFRNYFSDNSITIYKILSVVGTAEAWNSTKSTYTVYPFDKYYADLGTSLEQTSLTFKIGEDSKTYVNVYITLEVSITI